MAEHGTRLAELLGTLSLSTDLAAGLGNESALKVCLVATATARELGLDGKSLRTVYEASLLRFLGCTAYASETARIHSAGDDAAALRALSLVDVSKPQQVLHAALRGLAKSGPPAQRVTALLRFLGDPAMPRKLATAHCELARYLASQLAMGDAVVAALDQMYERFDGKGLPRSLGGEALVLPARLIHLGFRVVAHHTLLGPQDALDAVRERAGHELDPAVAAAFGRAAPAIFETLAGPSVWHAFLAAEPAPHAIIEGQRLAHACLAFATYADMKSPFMLGHSPAVAALARSTAALLHLGEDDQTAAEFGGLLHDLGRIGIPNGIWCKPGPLNGVEWERVRQHPYESERILRQSPVLAPLAGIAGMHHERLDGTGYHRGLAGRLAIPLTASIVAAADCYRSKVEDRPYRRAYDPASAATYLQRLATEGKLDRQVAEAVIVAAGQRPAVRRLGEQPAGLSDREREVLILVARGLTNKQVAQRLGISARTVQNHLASVFDKTGVSNRAAAALFAAQHRLVD